MGRQHLVLSHLCYPDQWETSLVHTFEKSTVVSVRLEWQRDIIHLRITSTRCWQIQWNCSRQSPKWIPRFPDTPIFPDLILSSSSEEEEDPTDKHIWWSPINLSTTVPMLSTAPYSSENSNTNMSITMAIMTHLQPRSSTGSADPLGSGGGPSGGGGGGAPGGGNMQAAAQPDGKPMGALPTVFKGDHSKAESFIWELTIYIIFNHDVSALASFMWRIAIALTCIKGPEVNWWTKH